MVIEGALFQSIRTISSYGTLWSDKEFKPHIQTDQITREIGEANCVQVLLAKGSMF